MRKTRLLATGTLALFLTSLTGLGTTTGTVSADHAVDPTIAVTTQGNLATFVILVRNNATRPLGTVEIKGKIPEGTTMTQSWAGSGPGNAPGRFTGGDMAVGWINREISAGRTQGPFVFTVDTGGQDVCSYAYVRSAGHESVSEAVTTDMVCTNDE